MKNALKFTHHGTIKIMSCYDFTQDCIVVHVQDSGVGISKADQQKLFKKFGKLKRTAEINSEGIGLGLMICLQLVK